MANQTTNGQPALTIEERLNQVETGLDSFELTNSLPAHCPLEVENESKRLLELTPSVLKSMTAPQCGEASYALQQFSFYLQKAVNKEQSRITWAEESIKRIISPILNQVTGISYDERRTKAICQNDAAQKLDKIRVEAQLRLSRISFLSQKVEMLAKAMMNVQMSRRTQ